MLHEPTIHCTGRCRLVRVVMVYDHGSGQALPWVVSKETYDRLTPKEPEPMPDKNDYVCADCGTEKDTMQGTCDSCGSVRIVLLSMIEQIAGPNWRDSFEPNPDPVTPDHPEVKAAEERG
jgi:hypothetical protein